MIFIVMGVCGSGKSTVGIKLADTLQIPFFDGDDFHPEANVQKMSDGIPLNDDDRKGWLAALHQKAVEMSETGAVFACSALKEHYRTQLSEGLENIHFVYLKGSYELIDQRMKQRKGHFMPTGLLRSQFDILEEPTHAIYVSITLNPDQIVQQIVEKSKMQKKEFGLIGLGVMGKSLARNLAGKGFKLSLYNRFLAEKEEGVADQFIEDYAELNNCAGFEHLPSFVKSLDTPRKIFLMVNAGKVTDLVIEELIPLLDEGDIIIDGGNSHYLDTERRIQQLAEKKINFVGTGVSGGEEGALKGPSIMPGGPKEAYEKIAPYLETIAARDKNGNGCCTYIGKGGSGHFVKMVHNGIEYAEMQLLAESYAMMRYALGMKLSDISKELQSWEKLGQSSYLLEITHKLLLKKEGDHALIDLILDKAGNKGTGSWTTTTMAELGIPATLISSSLFARYISSFHDKRKKYQMLSKEQFAVLPAFEKSQLMKAYALARLVNHQQGFELIKEASNKFDWELNLSELARIWTNGCIIRSELMETLINQLKTGIDLLLQQDQETLTEQWKSLRNFGSAALQSGISAPCHLMAADYLNAMMNDFPTANIIQAQRDFFGAHTYQRVDDSSGKSYHTIWE